MSPPAFMDAEETAEAEEENAREEGKSPSTVAAMPMRSKLSACDHLEDSPDSRACFLKFTSNLYKNDFIENRSIYLNK